MIAEISSPDPQDLGILNEKFLSQLKEIGEQTLSDPRSLVEPGRVSNLICLDEFPQDPITQYSADIAEEYLGTAPQEGSSAFISMITDADVFIAHTQQKKIAFDWHQEVQDTPTGMRHLPDPEEVQRLLIPLERGPLCATGNLVFDNAVVLGSNTISRADAIRSGKTVIGQDGVLVKSSIDPQGGEIFRAGANRVLHLPRTVHKGDILGMPKNRVSLIINLNK